MRLWSIHPSYLDAKGLVACWSETLLAQEVLKGNTKSYKNHPQLKRFKESNNPIPQLKAYLRMIWEEGNKRGYKFNFYKIGLTEGCLAPLLKEQLTVTKGQLEYEFLHLQRKLFVRDIKKRIENESKEWVKDGELLIHNILPNSIFKIIDGPVESWEKIK